MKKYFAKLFIVFVFVNQISAQTQVLDIQKLKSFGGIQQDLINCLIVSSDSSLCFGGSTCSTDGDFFNFTSLQENAYVIFVDTSLNNIKTIIWGGDGTDRLKRILRLTDTSFVFLYESNSSNGEYSSNFGSFDIYYRIYFTKQNWLSPFVRLGGTLDDQPSSICLKNSGGLIIGGKTHSSDGNFLGNFGSSDCFIANLTQNNTLAWCKNYGGSDIDEMVDIFQLQDGNILFFGVSKSNDYMVNKNKGGRDVWVVKLNSMGDTLWTKCYGGTGDDYALNIKKLDNDNFMIVGCSYSLNGDFYFVKNNNKVSHFYGYYYVVNSNGEFQYGASFSDTQNDIIFGDGIIENQNVDIWGIKNNDLLFASFQNNISSFTKQIELKNEEGQYPFCVSLGGKYYAATNTLTDTLPSFHGNEDVLIVKSQKITVNNTNIVNSFKLNIYPNPAQNQLFIGNLDNNSYSYSIVDLNGKEFISGSLQSNRVNIDKLDVGTYILIIYDKNKAFANKFMKVK